MNRYPWTLVGALLATLVLAPTGDSAAQRSQKDRFEETTSVVVVEVPVQVMLDGEPVRGLTADNFELVDGRKKQQVTGFETYDLSLIAQQQNEKIEAHEVPITARRHFLLLFDLSFAEPDSVLRARTAARDLIATALHPSDLVAVATYSQARSARIVLGFTPDRDQVEWAISTLGLTNPAEKVRDPLNLVVASFDPTVSDASTADDGGSARGVNVDALLVENARDLSILTNRANRDIQVQQITALTGSITGLAEILSSVQGRKHVVYLSEGFNSDLMLGVAGDTGAEQGRIAEVNRGSETGEYWRVDSEERFGSSAALSTMTQMVEALRRADCTIQSVDIGGVRAGGDTRGFGGTAESGSRAKGEQGLFFMANETGGELFRNYNDLGAAMGEMLERTSITYVLSFQPQDLVMDGSFHNLKVKLKDLPRGARAVHRPGYYAPKPFSEQSPAERTLLSAGIVLGGAEGGPIGTNVLAAPFRSTGTKSYVPLLIEIDGPDLLDGQTEGTIPAEIYGYAIDADGKIRDFFSQMMGLDLERVGGALSNSGFKFWGDFELDPGEYLVRVLVRNSANGSFTVRSSRLEVPVYANQQALLPPFFPEEPGKWLLGKEQSSTAQAEYDYPFMLQGDSFIPAAKPEISPGRPATIGLVGFNLGSELSVEGLLSGGSGEEVGRFPVTVESDPSSVGTERWIGRFKTASDLPAGDYQLELVARDAAGREVRSTPLEVALLR